MAGTNVIAAEIHQISSASSDISFDLELVAVLDEGPPPPPDTEAPSVPVGLVADEVTASSVSLSWDASTDNVAVDEYVVSRDGVAVGSTPSTSFVNGGLVASTAYTYTVEAFDAAGNGSGESDPLTVTTTEPPPGPVTLVGAGSVWRYLDDGSSPLEPVGFRRFGMDVGSGPAGVWRW